jgi:hypothetical protein
MALTKVPIIKIKPPPPAKEPPITSKTADTYTHHTSPVKGPQPMPAEVDVISSAPRAKIKTLPDAPMAKYKHVEEP